MNDDHDALLAAWCEREHHRGKGFIRDGIISPEHWKSAPRRILFLLKEAYGPPGLDWDLCGAIRDEWRGPRYKMWWALAYWAYGLHRLADSMPRFPLDDPEISLAREALLQCAVVNIKKSGGQAHSTDDDLRRYVSLDGDLVRRQVDLIDPDVVLCGYTWHLLGNLWDAEEVYDGVHLVGGRPVIAFWHPANQYPHKLNYYALGAMAMGGRIWQRTRRVTVSPT